MSDIIKHVTIIGEYPYPNKGIFLHKIGENYYNVSHNQSKRVKPQLVNKILTTFFNHG